MWRVVGVGVGLLRHDGEVEGVVVKDDAVLELCVRGRACYAQPGAYPKTTKLPLCSKCT